MPPTEQDTAREPSPLQGRKGVKKGNFWVLLGQLHILLCLLPPDLMRSWIMVCRPLHTSHTNSGYIFAELSGSGISDLALKCQLTSEEQHGPSFSPSFLSEPLYLGSVDFCTENTVNLLAYVE